MKKRTIISLLLVACMATMCFVGGTFAKYTSTVSGTDSATVALWSFEGVNLAENSVEFDLFADTILDVDNVNENDDVKAGKIAPGTSGSFAFDITNKSEVNATYAIAFTVENEADIPIVITYGGTAYAWDADANKFLSEEDAELAIAGEELEMETGNATPELSWVWAYEGNDSFDTNLGKTTPTISITATITFTQVN